MSESVPARPAPSSASEPEPREPLPRPFGPYTLFDRIGRGGMADIYLARARTELGGARLTVVKQILPRLARDESFSQMLVEEAKLAARLNHGNVVQVFDLGREQDVLYIAMEYVEGFDLNQLLRALTKARVPLPAEFAILVIEEVLRALDYAHRARDAEGRPMRLVHRDVSPSNVLVSFEGEVKLCDFGIARALGAPGSTGPTEEVVNRVRVAGKSAYMAPEHARGEDVDARSDIFAAGILLWELCAGRRLYRGSEEEMLDQARRGDVPPLPDRGLPSQAALQELLDRALAPDRADRYQRAADMLHELEGYAVTAGLVASPLRFGAFLTEHFGTRIVEARRARERAAAALEQGPPVVMTPVAAAEEDDVSQGQSEAQKQGGADEAASSGQMARREGGSHMWLVWVLLVSLGLVAFILFFGLR